MLNRIRGKLQGLFAYLAEPLVRARVNPNAVTLSGLVLGLLALLSTRVYPLMMLLLVAMVLVDALDGYVARALNKVTMFGAFLDSTVDRVEDAVTIYILFVLNVISVEELFASLVGTFLVSYTRSRAEALGVSMAGVGIAERAERLMLTLASLALYPLAPQASRAVFLVFLLLTYATVFQRVVYAARKLGGAS